MNDSTQTFKLLIRSREGVLYDGEVKSLTSINESGKFDILASHANFISLIQSTLEIGEVNGEIRNITIDNGLLRVKDNLVEIYLGVSGIRGKIAQV